jgi:hypothetical protein
MAMLQKQMLLLCIYERAEGHHSGKCRREGLNYTRLQQQSTDIKMRAKPECHQNQNQNVAVKH